MGNTVMYRIKDAATKETQGLRVYQPQVSNPQTDYQLDQRIKMAAVNNCYRALKPLIDRGFEGVDYGNLSRREFMKLALTNPYSGPYIIKGSTTPYPVLSPISKGSLPEVAFSYDTGGSFVSNIVINGNGDAVGDVSAALIASGYLAGDQVTIVVASRRNANSPVIVSWGSFFIDASDTRSLLDIVPEVEGRDDGGMWGLWMDEPDMLAAAVIISREGSHLRSTARFAVATNIQGFSELYQASAQAPARASYRRAAARSTSDWEEDPQTEGESGGTFTVQGKTITGTSVQLGVVYLTQAGSQALATIKITNEGNRAYNKFIVGKQFVAASYASEAPIGASDVIELGTGTDGALTEIESQFVNWLIDTQGYDYRTLTTMPT